MIARGGRREGLTSQVMMWLVLLCEHQTLLGRVQLLAPISKVGMLGGRAKSML
jgi:hypothetical protein